MIWELLIGFLKVGCFSFGGAYAAIPIIREVVLGYGWITDEMLSDMIAVSESTPGPIMVNLATYIGSRQAGLPGAAVATIAVVLPAFVIIILVVKALQKVIDKPAVQAAMNGLKSCVIGVILATGAHMIVNNVLKFNDSGVFDFRALLMTVLLAAAAYLPGWLKWKKKLSSLMLIGVGAVLGIVVYGIG